MNKHISKSLSFLAQLAFIPYILIGGPAGIIGIVILAIIYFFVLK